VTKRVDGKKPLYFEDAIDRAYAYKKWRRENLDAEFYVTDIDQMEARKVNGKLKPIAMVELTVRQPHPLPEPPQTYLAAILDRYRYKDMQGSILNYVAKKLDIYVYIVLLEPDDKLDVFRIYNYSKNNGWWTMDQDEYAKWIEMPHDLDANYDWDF